MRSERGVLSPGWLPIRWHNKPPLGYVQQFGQEHCLYLAMFQLVWSLNTFNILCLFFLLPIHPILAKPVEYLVQGLLLWHLLAFFLPLQINLAPTQFKCTFPCYIFFSWSSFVLHLDLFALQPFFCTNIVMMI